MDAASAATLWADAQDWLAQFPSQTLDAHCHIHHDQQFFQRAPQAQLQGWHYFCMTETPAEYEEFAQRDAWPGNATLGLGLHPWQVATEEQTRQEQLAAFSQALPGVRLVGEVGLDFSSRHAGNAEAQMQTFSQVAAWCAKTGGKVLSLHAVQSASQVLDVLEETGCIQSCLCIFHWFSGTGQDLVRARDLGCYFSCGKRMRGTKRGQAYATQITPQRLLFESDSYSFEETESLL